MTSSTADPHTFEYLLPSLGADMDYGSIIEWRVSVGDTVSRGDIIAVVDTEKSDIDIEIWHDGVIEEFLVPTGEEIDVGTPLARLRRLEGDTSPTPPIPASAATTPASERPRASPLARRLAAERGVDLSTVTGSGPSGAIVEADIHTSTPIPDATPPTHQPQDATAKMRALIAERMTRSNSEIPHYYLSRVVDLTALENWLTAQNAERSITERLLPAALYIRAVGLAAARHRELNGYWNDGRFEPGPAVNVAMAISLRKGGLVTPHVADADKQSPDEIMSTLTELVNAARSGGLRSSWMTGATITSTNLGETGADLVHGVISPPQVALVGFGRPALRPWVVNDELVARTIATVTLAADHRATDGAVGSRFLATLASLLEDPEKL